MSLGTTLETTQGQIDCLLIQLSFKCYLPEVASLEMDLRFAPGLPPGWCIIETLCVRDLRRPATRVGGSRERVLY